MRVAPSTSLPPYLYKSSMPNICQTDERSEFLRRDGEIFCSPVSTADFVIHLAKRHFSSIVEPQGRLQEHEAWFRLIDKLAKHMKTDRHGTDDDDLKHGLKKYVRDRGYKIKFKEEIYEGQKDFSPEVISDPLMVMPYTIGTSNALLSVAFCKFNPESGKYKHIEGHYVSLAGFISKGTPKLIVHDPNPATKRKSAVCELFEITEGTLHKWYTKRECEAAGFNELEGIGIHEDDLKKGANKIVLDGILAFEVYRK